MLDYTGNVAKNYEDRRKHNKVWKQENKIITSILDEYPEGTTLLDIPIGTGRFLPDYLERGFSVLGVDISNDMINQASNVDDNVVLIRGSAFDLPLKPTKYVDLSVCIRFLTWFNIKQISKVLHDLVQITKKGIIFSVWVGDSAKGGKNKLQVNSEEKLINTYMRYHPTYHTYFTIKTKPSGEQYRIYYFKL